MNENKKRSILINIAFIAIVLPIAILIYYGDMSIATKFKFKSLANPLGLYIESYKITQDQIILYIKNPNNETYNIYFTDIRYRNSFGSTSMVVDDPNLGVVFTIYPYSTLEFVENLQNYDMSTKTVIYQWLKAGGTLTIVLDYSLVNNPISGSIIINIQS